MKKLVFTLVASGAVFAASGVFAAENWTTRLPGVTEGLASGALPPQGVYFVNETLFTPTHLYKGGGDTAVRLDAFVDVPIVEWATGYKILGADFAMAIAQPFDYITTTNGATIANGTNLGSGGGMYDTLIIPAMLSWALPSDFHVMTELGIWAPTGSKDTARMAVQNSNRYWAVEPGVGLSWLHDGWAANVMVTYDFNFEKSADNALGATNYKNYRSGDQLIVEYSVQKTIGKWTFGIGGYGLEQVEKDHATRADGTGVDLAGTVARKYAIGPMVGYNFGPVIVQAYYHENIVTNDYVGGNEFWTRVLVPF